MSEFGIPKPRLDDMLSRGLKAARERLAAEAEERERERHAAELSKPPRVPSRITSKEERRAARLRSKYQLLPGDYDAMLASQGGGCAICDSRFNANGKPFVVDHCHKTTKVRGLLCSTCNTGIGHLRDSEFLLARAIEYLRKSKQDA